MCVLEFTHCLRVEMSAKRRLNMRRTQRLPPSLSAEMTMIVAASSAKAVDEFWFERSDHPLLNDVILTTLFPYVKPNDLKSCRLVCKKWNVLSLPFVRSTFHVTIRSGESSSSGNLVPNIRTITDFVQLFDSNTLGFPFQNFILGSFNPTIGIGKKFLQRCGKTAKRFNFLRTAESHTVENIAVFLKAAPMLESICMPCSLYSKQEVKGVKLKLFKGNKVPELKNLKTLESFYGFFKEKRLIWLSFYEEILRAANISTLIATKRDTEESVELLNILENLGRGSSLESLELFSVTEKHLEVLKKMYANGLKLKHLNVLYSQPSDDSFSFELIDLMKNSLISVHFRIRITFPQKFPKMPNLQRLDFAATPNGNVQENILEDLYQNYPRLQNLGLGISADQFSIGTECCPAIKSLRIQKLINMNGQSFASIISVCPNLTELEVDVTQDGPQILRMIWTQLQRLEKLNIYGRLPSGNNLDSIFTGILDEGKRTVISGKLNGLKHMASEVRRQTILNLIDEYKTLPSIGNLTSLRELTLIVTAWRGQQSRLTDMAGYLGLHSLKTLRNLSVSLCKFSKSCSQILVEDLELESWVFQRNAQTDIISPRRPQQ